MKNLKKVYVIELGYVGLPNTVVLLIRFSVIGVDVDVKKVEVVNSGMLSSGAWFRCAFV